MATVKADACIAVLAIFDGSLHHGWDWNATERDSLLASDRPSACSRMLRTSFRSDGDELILRSRRLVLLPSAARFSVKYSCTAATSAILGPSQSRERPCKAHVCLAALDAATQLPAPQVPLCTRFESSLAPWNEVHVPASMLLGGSRRFDELRFVGLPGVSLTIAELSVTAALSRAGSDTAYPSQLPRYLLPPVGYALPTLPRARDGSDGRCDASPAACAPYMEPAAAQTTRQQLPLCQMDGDHLRGRWEQSCDPQRIGRPDHFAYGRSLPVLQGGFDYRFCFQQSANERLRSAEALSWSWRPDGCRLEPVRGFSEWLGERTLLFVGDSLTAQHFYSLVWLLGGDAGTEELLDLEGLLRVEQGARVDRCATSMNSEGGGASRVSRVRLRHGGVVYKVMRHGELEDELRNLSRVSWLKLVRSVDILLLNVGHWHHRRDPGFARYEEDAEAVTRQLELQLKPSAHVVYRTTNVGHPGCESAARPLRSRLEAWSALAPEGGDADLFTWNSTAQLARQTKSLKDSLFRDPHSWRGPPLFEAAWAESAARRRPDFARRFWLLNVSFVDQRADGHVAGAMRAGVLGSRQRFPLDCLHYCFPGPADYWALALVNLLRRQVPAARQRGAAA